MMDLSDKTCLVYDYYDKMEIAIRLAKDFGKVFYTGPYVMNGSPSHEAIDMARNVPNIERVREWSEVIDQVDIVVSTDAHEPYLQKHWKSLGLRVFGSFFACELENNRRLGKQTLYDVGLPVGIYYKADGVDELEERLKTAPHSWVKGGMRGDGETWEHKSWEFSKGELLDVRHNLQIFQSQPKYTIEHHIDGLAEIGMDIPTTGGKFTSHCMAGLEVKDCMYVCKIVPYHSLPFQLTDITSRLAPIFNDMEYSGIFSDEVIIGEDKRGYMLDFTCRFGQPPTSIITSMWKNFSEIIWKIAGGIIPEIEYEFEYAVQFIIKSDIAETRPSPIRIPTEYREFVKIKNLVIDEDGTWYYTPNGMKMKEIGAVVGLGHSIQEAHQQASKITDSIEGFDVFIKSDAMDKAKRSLDRLKKAGINFI
jgi:hypothetical protein